MLGESTAIRATVAGDSGPPPLKLCARLGTVVASATARMNSTASRSPFTHGGVTTATASPPISSARLAAAIASRSESPTTVAHTGTRSPQMSIVISRHLTRSASLSE